MSNQLQERDKYFSLQLKYQGLFGPNLLYKPVLYVEYHEMGRKYFTFDSAHFWALIPGNKQDGLIMYLQSKDSKHVN